MTATVAAPRPDASVRPAPALFALAMGGFAIGTTEFAAMSLLPDFAAGLGIDVPTAGHVISAYALGVVVGAPAIAVLGARAPRRLLLIGLMAVFALFNALTAVAPDYRAMLVFRFLSGLPHGAYFGVGALVAASLVPRERRTRAVSLMMTGLTVATVLGVPLATWLGQVAGSPWRAQRNPRKPQCSGFVAPRPGSEDWSNAWTRWSASSASARSSHAPDLD